MRIRFKVFITFAGVLFTAMSLMSMAILYMSQRFLIQSEVEKGKAVGHGFLGNVDLERMTASEVPTSLSDSINRLIRNQELLAVCISVSHGDKPFFIFGPTDLAEKVSFGVRRSFQDGKESVLFYKPAWNFFLKLPTVAVVTLAIEGKKGQTGAAAFAVPLANTFRQLRIIQEFLLLYLFINTALFSIIGSGRIALFFLRPIRKLVHRATEFRPGDGFLLPYEGDGSEWETLSRAINRIVELNLKDNQKLSETVVSLQQAVEDLEKAQQEMIRAEKLATVGRLSSGIAHEMGNPIGIILGYLELVQQPSFPEAEKLEIIRHTEIQVRRIDQIIRQLLDFSRPVKEMETVVSVHAVVIELLDMMHLHPLFSSIEISKSLLAERDVVKADYGQLHQAFLNLILNAADAIEAVRREEGGRIGISSAMVSGGNNSIIGKPSVRISVADNGEGIPPEHIGEIFDPFFTTKAPGKGTGLGLWVSFMIIEGFGGKIQVESRVGVGTTMNVYLPLVGD